MILNHMIELYTYYSMNKQRVEVKKKKGEKAYLPSVI